jgi:hypothetical protein
MGKTVKDDRIIDRIKNKKLRVIADKAAGGIPVSEADALIMLGTNDILELGLIAHALRTRLHADVAYYEVNMNLNYTNVCELRCPLCAYSRAEGDAGAFTLSLTEIEFSLIKEHSRRGFEMLKDVESPWPLAQIVYQHRERMDGSGYPRNLKGDDILMEARIMAAADVVESMASTVPIVPH